MQARRAAGFSKIFSTKEKSEHLVASKVQSDERQRQREAQAQLERSQRSEQDANDKGGICSTEASDGNARRMLKFFEDSEVQKVSVREVEGQVLSPNESRVNIVRIARQPRQEKRTNLFQSFRQGENELLFASKARRDDQ